jgi:LPS sulfotransferase NodH
VFVSLEESLPNQKAINLFRFPIREKSMTSQMFNKICTAVYNPRNTADYLVRKISFKIFDHTNYKRFIVLARSRVGSNLLISYLNSHPNIAAENEIFQRLNGNNCSDILLNLFSKQPLYIRARGFKIFYYHPIDDDSHEIWDLLVNIKDLHVIHLKRRNILRTLISRKLAEIQGAWVRTTSNNVDHHKSVEFDKEELEGLFRQTRLWESNGESKFRNHPFVTIYYEDLVNELESAMGKVYSFLGLRYVQPKTFMKKQNPETLHELVKNYKQMKRAFHGTEWQEFFEE